MSRWLRRLGWLGGLMLLGYAGVCGYFWVQQDRLVFEPESELLSTPARNGMHYEDVRILSGSGAERAELAGWWIPAQAAAAPTLLYLHGNFRNISLRPEYLLRLHELGYNLLLVDYRGYGKSGGSWPSEARMYEDAEAAWGYLVRQRGLPPARIFIYGHSMGGAVAIDLAVRHPEAAGLIVESSFTSMQAMGEKDYGFLPIGLLLNQRFDSIGKVADLRTPLLILHGSADRKIPWEMGKRLYEQAPQPKTFRLIEGGEHSNVLNVSWPEYREAVDGFVRRNLGRS